MATVIEHALKRRWHRDLVADPVTHGWVLNLYRAGERHPETVRDYFPARHAPWPWLSDALERHRRDEHRHGVMLAGLLRRIEQPVDDDVPDADVFNHVIRRCTGRSLAIADDADEAARRLGVAHFLAHAHHLERRVARSLEYHLEACALAGDDAAVKVFERVLADERRHVAYTAEALDALLPRAEREAVMEAHRRAEARANLLFSQRQVRRYLAAFGDRCDRRERLLYQLCAWLQERASDHV